MCMYVYVYVFIYSLGRHSPIKSPVYGNATEMSGEFLLSAKMQWKSLPVSQQQK